MASSAFLQVVFQIAANFLAEEVRLMHAVPKEIEDLQTNVNMIIATLQVATINPSRRLKIWLDDLRDVGYDAIDLLDKHNTELLRRNLVHAAELRNKLTIANPKRFRYWHSISHKIKDVSLKMHNVLQRQSLYGFNINESSSVRDRHEITTSLPPTLIVGRENERSEILGKLIPYNNVQVGILAIHGLGRIGKTTLAQLIYEEFKKRGYFNMTLWVHVSYEFDLEKVTRSILDSMGEQQVGDINLGIAQKHIQAKLEGKRYLLVLDDFSNDNMPEWEKLIRPLQKGAPGSVIIVTTSTGLVAEMVSTISSHHLKELSEQNCYSLVCHYASRNDRHERALNALRSNIINKCKGMPEEAIDLGVRLSREHDEEKWNEVIEKWGEGHAFSEERSRSVNFMRLHYSRLPSDLKPCLAYCSIIPKGMQFEKEWIVQLWMAQNFIAKQSEQSIEDIGNNYFDQLVERSFFHRTRTGLNKGRYEYSIPDVVHQVAQNTSAEECCIFELGMPHNPTNTTRHMSIILTTEELSSTLNPFTEIYHFKGLYTLLVTVNGSLINHSLGLPDDLLNSLPRLRTLDLSYCKLDTLPNNIGDLKHLRYLQLRYSNIQELPESIGKLYNLQTLGLRNCLFLRKLPKETRNLQKLLHLDLHLDYVRPNANHQDLRPIVNQMVSSCENLGSMPPEIGLLTNLQVLSRFVVSTGRHCGLNELRNLNSIQGELSISNLDLVKNSNDAAEANLQEKIHVKRLEFLWREDRVMHERNKEDREKILVKRLEFLWREDRVMHECNKERRRTEMVLENLKPSSNIKELIIVGYTGVVLPSWLGSVYLTNLQTISLFDCTNCIELPPLGNLPFLQEIYVEGLHSVRFINCKFCVNNQNCFPSLKKIVFENMLSMEEWTGGESCELSHLSELVLKDCHNLQRLTHKFPLLTKLTIEKLPKFIGLRKYPSLKYLKVVECSDWISGSGCCLSSLLSLTLSQLPSKTLTAGLLRELDSLQSLEISYCENLAMFPDDWIPSGVTYLCIKQCPMLRELPKRLETIKKLEDLVIQDCKNLVSLPKLKNLKSLTRLEISGCPLVEFLPREGLPDALHFLSIGDCPLFSKQFKDLKSLDRIKIKHVSSVWIDQKHLTSHRTQGESSTWRR